MLEFSLRNVLNNFKECWWDHLVVDILGCNLLGIIVGFYVIDYFKLERYRWSLRDAPFHCRSFSQIRYFFTHWDLSGFETKSLSTMVKFMQLVWYIAFVSDDLWLDSDKRHDNIFLEVHIRYSTIELFGCLQNTVCRTALR